MTRVLVVGGNGFLGSSLVDQLALFGHDVRVLDRMSRPRRFVSDVQVLTGSITDGALVRRATRGVDIVVHTVWESTPISADSDPFPDISRNVGPSVRLMQACNDNGVGRFVFFSTSGAMYGHAPDPSPEHQAAHPISPYGIGKLAVEGFLEYYSERYGLSQLVYRISNPYGGRQSVLRRQGVIPIFLDRIGAGTPITVYGDGSMTRDYIFAEDVAAIVAANFDRDLPRTLYNLGSGRSATVNEVIRLAESVTGRTAIREIEPRPRTFIQTATVDISALLHDHVAVELTSLEAGVTRTWRAMHTVSSTSAGL